jgi:hypothetical protein
LRGARRVGRVAPARRLHGRRIGVEILLHRAPRAASSVGASRALRWLSVGSLASSSIGVAPVSNSSACGEPE